jgi:hypothetical protein
MSIITIRFTVAIEEAEQFLSTGDKKKAIEAFKEAVSGEDGC